MADTSKCMFCGKKITSRRADERLCSKCRTKFNRESKKEYHRKGR